MKSNKPSAHRRIRRALVTSFAITAMLFGSLGVASDAEAQNYNTPSTTPGSQIGSNSSGSGLAPYIVTTGQVVYSYYNGGLSSQYGSFGSYYSHFNYNVYSTYGAWSPWGRTTNRGW